MKFSHFSIHGGERERKARNLAEETNLNYARAFKCIKEKFLKSYKKPLKVIYPFP